MKKMNKKGFTLIEMLAVIAIIAVLVAIIVPAVGNSTMKATAATNAANLRNAAATITIDYVNGTLTTDTNGKVTGGMSLASAPTEEKDDKDGITGGDFTAVVKDGQVICTFGTDGTIDNYSKVAQTGKAISAQ